MTELTPGLALDERYQLKGLLGTGGMASVWLARDQRLERPVAVKILADTLALDSGYVARFAREARIAGGLTHPHLVRIYDYSTHGSRPYLVMEYIPGGTLADRLQSPRDAAWDPVALSRELLDALSYVHASGIVHRDIKPANILIGSDGRARLTDFGIATPPEASRLTAAGDVLGTQRYLAPEVLRGEPADIRSDLYACGVLIGQCAGPAAPEALRDLVERLTAHDPRARPASAAEACHALDGVGPVAPAPPGADGATGATRATRPAAATSPAMPAAGDSSPTRVLTAPHPAASTTSAGSLTRTRIGAVLGVVALVVVAVLLLGRWSGEDPGPGGAPPPGTPVTEQLDQLDDAIDRL